MEKMLQKELKRLFSIQKEEIRGILLDIPKMIKDGTQDKQSDFLMIPSYVAPEQKNFKPQNHIAFSVDLGGSNLRIGIISFFEKKPKILFYKEIKIEKKYFQKDLSQIHLKIAKELKTLWEKIPKEIKAMMTMDYIPLGYTFSYAVSLENINKGKILRVSKNLNNDVVGKNPVEILQNYLNQEKLDFVKVVALLNDTISTQMSANFLNPKIKIGGIIGTGTNFCIAVKTKDIKKKIAKYQTKEMYLNIESGGYSKIPQNIIDKYVDEKTENPKKQLQEKMVSGKYLIIIFKESIKYFQNQNLLEINKKTYQYLTQKFKTEDMSFLEKNFLKNRREVEEFFKQKANTEITEKELRKIFLISKAISDRASLLSALMILGIIKYYDPNFKKEHIVALDGSIYKKYFKMKNRIEKNLKKYSSGKTIEIFEIENGNILGGAFVAYQEYLK